MRASEYELAEKERAYIVGEHKDEDGETDAATPAMTCCCCCGALSLFSRNSIPAFLQEKHIHSAYRFGLSWKKCALSVFHLHNETMNIWTHLIGFLIFVVLLVYTFGFMQTPPSLSASSTSIYSWMNTSSRAWDEGMPAPLHLQQLSGERVCEEISQAFLDALSKLRDDLHTVESDVTPMVKDVWKSVNVAVQEKWDKAAVHVQEANDVLHSQLEKGRHALQHKMEEAAEAVRESREVLQAAVRSALNRNLERAADALHRTRSRILGDVDNLLGNLGTLGHLTTPSHRVTLESSTSVARWPILVFMLAAQCCLLFSTLFHWFGCRSKRSYSIFGRLDYTSISLLIFGSFVPAIYYSFYGYMKWQIIYCVCMSVFALGGIIISLFEVFYKPQYRTLRGLMFLGMGLFGIFPLGHMVVKFGFGSDIVSVTLWRFLTMGGLYIMGLFVFVTRVPERWFPGKFDIWFHSHQFWHMFVLSAALVHFDMVIRMWQLHSNAEFTSQL